MRKWHKWVGLFLTFFLLMSAVSGIFLNHRRAISSVDISRSILSKEYRYANWNNGSVKASLSLSPDSILIYGNNGIWLTDANHQSFSSFKNGIKAGADNYTVGSMVKNENGDVFAATTFDLYKLDRSTGVWQNLSHLIDTKERYTSLVATGDSLVLMTRSHIYVARSPFTTFARQELMAPQDYKKEATLFRTMWTLHSGELFGVAGKIFVDILGLLTTILCVSGLLLTFCPKIIKRKNRSGKDSSGSIALFKGSLKWHNKVGAWFFVFLLIVCVTGMFLRPPLLISIIKGKTKPLPGTILNSDNPWFDKLRCLCYDEYNGDWVLYSSGGFFTLETLESIPVKLKDAPPVSVMGVTVLEQQDSVRWVVGSFSGIYQWNRMTGRSTDYFTGEQVVQKRSEPPVFSNAISGYSSAFAGKNIVFGYSSGAISKEGEETFAVMPAEFGEGNISLWHLCLEIHVGRIYEPLLGSILSSMYVFIWGSLFLIVLITGYLIYSKRNKKSKG